MNRFSRTLFAAAAAFVLLFSAACGPGGLLPAPTPTPKPVDPAELLSTAFQNLTKTDSVKIALTTTVDLGGISLTMTGGGALKPTQNQTYMKMTVSGQIVEVLQLSASESYTRQGGEGAWTAAPAGQIQTNSLYNPSFLSDPEQFGQLYQNPAYAGTESVDGILCDRVTYDFDLQKILGQTLSAVLTAEQLAAISGAGTGEVFVAQSDGLPRQMIMNMSFTIAGANATLQGTEADVTMVMKYSGYNEPVELPTVE